MPKTTWADRPSSMRALGFGLIAVLLFFVWLTWAFFNNTFTDYDEVRVTGVKSGLSLPTKADVKLRGQIVGLVRKAEVKNGQVVLTLGMFPSTIDDVPAGVGAQIVPKTLFGEKFVDLIPPKGADTQQGHLRAGDTITNAVVPVEVEQFLNDIYPLLTAVPPENVAKTLTALADSLDGRGQDLGETLEVANNYLVKITPETRQAISDLQQLGTVAGTYSSQADEFGHLLRSTAEVSRNTTRDRDDLADFFDESTDLSKALEDLFDGLDPNIIKVARNSLKPLQVLQEYASIFPCLLKGTDRFTVDNLDEIMENGTLHISLFPVSPQPTIYALPERPTFPSEKVVESLDLTQPETHGLDENGGPRGLGTACDQLYAYARGEQPYTHENPIPVPGRFWKLVGIRNSHNGKLGTEADYADLNRPVASGLGGVDSTDERKILNGLTAGMTGIKPSAVPDIASLMISPMVRGAGVEIQ